MTSFHFWMTDEELKAHQRLRAAAPKAPLYERILQWPVCLLIYSLMAIAAPFIYTFRFVMRNKSNGL
jgi:hypothetical protein